MKIKQFNTIIYFFAAFAAGLLTCRISKTDQLTYLFLGWNLFLAFIPYWISGFLKQKAKLGFIHFPLICAWILFLPNAPYIVTDLFHFKKITGIPQWYDLILLCSFAITGLLLMYRSLVDMLQVLKTTFIRGYLNYLLPFLFWLIAFGLYLGRYLRLNSWDVASHPLKVARSGVHTLFCKDAMAFSLIFAVFMWLMFMALINFNKQEKHA